MSSSNQLLRADQVRTPTVTDQWQAATNAASAVTLEDFESYVVSQLRLIIGSSAWTDVPPASLQAIAALLTDVPVVQSTCQSTDLVGALVCVGAAGGSVVTADAMTTGSIPAIGVITQKSNPTTCMVQTQGVVTGLFTNLTIGARYFLGRAGALICPPLTDPGLLYVQQVGVATASNALRVAPLGTLYKRDLG